MSIKNNALWVSANSLRKVQLEYIQEIKRFLDETTFIAKGRETLVTTQLMSEDDKESF